MSKGRKIAASAALLVVVFAAVFALGGLGRRPFRSLEGVDIASATVRLTPPDATMAVADTDTLARLLSEAVVYRQDGSWTDYAGQGVEYTLTLSDGTVTTVMEYNPFIVIDGVGYRAKGAPCEALSRFGNALAER